MPPRSGLFPSKPDHFRDISISGTPISLPVHYRVFPSISELIPEYSPSQLNLGSSLGFHYTEFHLGTPASDMPGYLRHDHMIFGIPFRVTPTPSRHHDYRLLLFIVLFLIILTFIVLWFTPVLFIVFYLTIGVTVYKLDTLYTNP